MRLKVVQRQTALSLLIGCAALAFVSAQANATPVSFFGEDPNATGNVPIPHPVSDATRNTFFSNLNNPGTENFEGFSTGTSVVAANFMNGVTATLSGGVVQSGTSAGRFAISGSNYYNTNTTSFSINFSSAISAFGFYGTDIGDFGGQLSLTLTDKNGVTSTLLVPNLIGAGGAQPENGSALYFGFYDTGNTYTSIAFNNSAVGDQFGFDDFTVGTAAQVTPVPSVPLPPALPMFGAAIVALGAAGYGFKRKQVATR